MNVPEISKRLETLIAIALSNAAAPYLRTVVPEQGDAELDAPYAVVAAGEGTEIIDGVWEFPLGTVTIVTHIGDTRSDLHSAMVRQLREKLRTIPRGVYSDGKYRMGLSGIDVTTRRTVQDNDAKSHGDVIFFSAGCTEMEAEP